MIPRKERLGQLWAVRVPIQRYVDIFQNKRKTSKHSESCIKPDQETTFA
jgi:hypothetical protein